MEDTITDEGYTLDFTMFVKKWGADWKSEANAGNLVPPGIDGYNAAIDAGELPPIGKAPYGYEEDAAEPAKESTEETIGETTKEAAKETVQESTAAAVGFDSGSGTGTISDFSGKYSANISFTLPETGWKIKNQGSTNSTLYLYNVADPTYLFSGDPRIEFNLKESNCQGVPTNM